LKAVEAMAGMAGVPKLAAVISLKMSVRTSWASCFTALWRSVSRILSEVSAFSLAVMWIVLKKR
jgi:hypothetical protein